jgi:hypothetical protein
MEAKLSEKEQEIKTLNTDLIKIKKNVKLNQAKFRYRHKFTVQSCVYILQDPDHKVEKYKIGMTTNINIRLASDRTMIPDLKVRYIIYTVDAEMFEKNIKFKCRNNLESGSHEWVRDSLRNLIDIYEGINKANGFFGETEVQDELDKYNMDEEVKEVRVNWAYNQNMASILPTYLNRHDYIRKNKDAVEGQRWCNGFCQNYRLICQFEKRSRFMLSVCNECTRKIDIARLKIASGISTPEQIRSSPGTITLDPDQQICRKCKKVLHHSNFPDKRRQCKTCRNNNRSQYGKNFHTVIEDEIKTLRELPALDREVKIEKYTKDELQKIMQFLSIGRKFYDRKDSMKAKILAVFNSAIETPKPA